MQVNQGATLPKAQLDNLPDDSQIEEMLQSNCLPEFYTHLKTEFRINYEELAKTARDLKTIDKDIVHNAVHFFSRD